LLELLVVIMMIGIVVAISIPAVQSAREAMRRSTCQNNLRQIGLAAQSHVSSHRHFPTGGWGYCWVGVDSAGYGQDQPGSWVFNLLPYLEKGDIRQSMLGTVGSPLPANRFEFSLPVVRCPTRPGGDRGPHRDTPGNFNTLPLQWVAKTDYAANEGNIVTDTKKGPLDQDPQSVAAYPWADTSKADGICFQRSLIKPGDITDGLSNTYFAGEKQVFYQHYNRHINAGYDQSAWCGIDVDVVRWTSFTPKSDAFKEILARRFGSAHASGFNMVMCDGSVRPPRRW